MCEKHARKNMCEKHEKNMREKNMREKTCEKKHVGKNKGEKTLREKTCEKKHVCSLSETMSLAWETTRRIVGGCQGDGHTQGFWETTWLVLDLLCGCS